MSVIHYELEVVSTTCTICGKAHKLGSGVIQFASYLTAEDKGISMCPKCSETVIGSLIQDYASVLLNYSSEIWISHHSDRLKRVANACDVVSLKLKNWGSIKKLEELNFGD